MKMGWLLGWAVPEAWFAPLVRENFPRDEHVFFPAGPEVVARLHAAGPFDHVVGHSLGAHLLLAANARGNRIDRVSLLAPIFSFPVEENLGGRVARTQVRHLTRWLRRDPAAALADFYLRAGLDVPAATAPIDETENLLWGLERLECDRVAPSLPAGWRAWVGADDPMLNAARLATIVPDIMIVPQATHHPIGLLRALAEAMR